jgi:hypothetical protein
MSESCLTSPGVVPYKPAGMFACKLAYLPASQHPSCIDSAELFAPPGRIPRRCLCRKAPDAFGTILGCFRNLERKRLPCQGPKIKPRQRVEALAQRGQHLPRLTELLPTGSQHCTDPGRLRRRRFQQPLESPGLAEIREQFLDCFLWSQLACRAAFAEEVKQSGVRLGEGPPGSGPAGVDDRL